MSWRTTEQHGSNQTGDRTSKSCQPMSDDKIDSKAANSVDSSQQTGAKKKPTTVNSVSPRRPTQAKLPYEEHEELNKSLVSLFFL